VGDLPEPAVVSLGKLTAGHEEYYEREVAGGAEDYYAMRGEAAGEWVGSGAQALGLDGTAAGAQLRALLEGRDPGTGEMLRSQAVKVNGSAMRPLSPGVINMLIGLLAAILETAVEYGHISSDPARGRRRRGGSSGDASHFWRLTSSCASSTRPASSTRVPRPARHRDVNRSRR
jgi:hypothetical protein